MLHVVFQQADVNTLKKAIDLDNSLQGSILEIKDDFAVGPLEDIDTDKGWVAREDWWKGLLAQSPYASENLVGSFDDRKTVEELKTALDENEKEVAWLWMGQNQ